jgi:hypothetical protein
MVRVEYITWLVGEPFHISVPARIVSAPTVLSKSKSGMVRNAWHQKKAAKSSSDSIFTFLKQTQLCL